MMPQLILVVLLSMQAGLAGALHGRLPAVRYNFWMELLRCAILAFLLGWGGFWNVFMVGA